MTAPRPCIDCHRPQRNGTRCPPCTTTANRPRNAAKNARPHYQGDYRRRAAIIRATATHCHLCPRPYTPDDPPQADHLIPGDPTSPLLAAHRSCNARRGNKPLDYSS